MELFRAERVRWALARRMSEAGVGERHAGLELLAVPMWVCVARVGEHQPARVGEHGMNWACRVMVAACRIGCLRGPCDTRVGEVETKVNVT